MSVITVERIKLFSTRSPWWCMVIAAVLTVCFAALTTGFLNSTDEQQATYDKETDHGRVQWSPYR